MNEKKRMSLEQAVDLYNSIGLESRNMNFFSKWVYEAYKIAYIPGTDQNGKGGTDKDHR